MLNFTRHNTYPEVPLAKYGTDIYRNVSALRSWNEFGEKRRGFC